MPSETVLIDVTGTASAALVLLTIQLRWCSGKPVLGTCEHHLKMETMLPVVQSDQVLTLSA